MAPTMAASASTERNTCRRLAPTTRSKASSRVRWPTVIENVLKMVNAPTNREMKAKTSKAVEKNESAWSTALVFLLYHGLPGDDLGCSRQGAGDVPLDYRLVGPRFDHDVDVVEMADLPDDELSRRQGERGQGGAGQVGGVAELRDARYGVGLQWPGGQDADRLAHLEVVFLGRAQRPLRRRRRSSVVFPW